jgi:hypothetical protein
MMQHLPFIYVEKVPQPYMRKERASKSHAVRQQLDAGILAWTFL